MADQYWSSVVLAMPMDGPDNSTTFNELKGKTVTRYGDAKISTAQSKFGGASAYFDGTGDYLTVPASADFNFGTGDFTVELWVRFDVVFGPVTLISNRQSSSAGWGVQCRGDLGTIRFVRGDTVVSSAAWAPSVDTWYHVAVARAGTSLRMFVNGVQIGSTGTDSSNYTSTAALSIGKVGSLTSQYIKGYIDDVRVTTGVARYTANFSPPTSSYLANPTLETGTIVSALVGAYGLYDAHIEQAVEGYYHLLAAVAPAGLVGRYSLLLEQGLIGRYQDAAIILAGLVGRYQDAPQVLAGLVGRYGDMVPVLAALVGRYHLMHDVLAGLDGRYAIAGEAILAGLVGNYDLRDRNEVLAGLLGYYSLMADAQVVQPACQVLIGGAPVRWSQLSWTESEDSYLIEATIVLRDPAEHRAIAKQDQVLLTWMGTTYTLYVAALLRSRSVSGSPGDAGYSADYVVVARSLTAGLDAPHALPITREWPEATLASQIAVDLVAGLADIISLDFRLEDWLQPGGTFFVTDEPPLAGLAKLAGLIGGVLQTAPDNTLILRMQDVISPAQWAGTTPAWTIEDSGLFSDSESEAESNRYNVVTVTNQSESTEAIRFEVEDLGQYRKRVRGYRVPWALFDLATSGGPWVTIEAEGVVEEQITEVIEIVDGSGQASKPIYSQVAAAWLQTSLGAITGAEDGSLTTAVPGCSMAEITYTTRYMAWIGASPRDEEVQFYQVEILP